MIRNVRNRKFNDTPFPSIIPQSKCCKVLRSFEIKSDGCWEGMLGAGRYSQSFNTNAWKFQQLDAINLL